jgi:predicted RNA-binding Zn-ribbon protein involved in translation (DUF1610 family)
MKKSTMQRPTCSDCKMPMTLSGTLMTPDMDIRHFKCPKCGYIRGRIIMHNKGKEE